MMPQIDGLVQPAETPDMMWWYFRTLGELVDRANEIRKKEREEGCTYWFRGEGAFFSHLEPMLSRCGVRHERDFYQSALSSTPERFRGLESVFDRLTLMRHYGYPVRLLDIAQNVLTSWFMALDSWRGDRNDLFCAQPESPSFAKRPYPCPRIAVVRVPNGRVKAAESDLVANLSMLAKVEDEFSFGKLWHEVRQERRDFDEEAFWDSADEMFENWCVLPRMSNTRVDVQQGAFVLFGLHRDALRGRVSLSARDAQFPLRKSHGMSYNHILPEQQAAEDAISLAGYLVPDGAAVAACGDGDGCPMTRYVEQALWELEGVGISERALYHDDLERHARHWIRHYKNR